VSRISIPPPPPPNTRVNHLPTPGDLGAAVGRLRDELPTPSRLIVILGSGFTLSDAGFVAHTSVPYSEIPGFPRTTVQGHPGNLIAGSWSGVEVAVMQGRSHLYEGWSAADVVFPLRVLASLGCDHLIVTNAAGGIRPGMAAGDLMLIADHINLMFRNPLTGPLSIGPDRFPDMSDPYDAGLRRLALGTAAELGIDLASGVYAGVLGPSFETPAELRMLSRLGADAVGMSTVPEVVAARAIGMRVLGFSTITNSATGAGEKVTHEDVLRTAGRASEKLSRLVQEVIRRLPLEGERATPFHGHWVGPLARAR